MVDNDKQAQLEALLHSLQHQWGAGAVRRLRELPARRGLQTGFASLDTLLGTAGIPIGQVTELIGKLTSGMTTLAYHTMATLQQADTLSIYLDLDSTFDADYAHRCGVSLTGCFVARPNTDTRALDLARDVLESGSVGLVVLDMGALQVDTTHLRRLTAVLAQAPCAVLLLRTLPPSAGGLPTSSPAALRLLVERAQWIERYADIRGYQARVTLLKHPTATGKTALIDIDFDTQGGVR